MAGLDDFRGELDKPYGAQVSKPVSFRQQIQATLQHHERELERQKKLLELLDANPAIEEFMNLTRS